MIPAIDASDFDPARHDHAPAARRGCGTSRSGPRCRPVPAGSFRRAPLARNRWARVSTPVAVGHEAAQRPPLRRGQAGLLTQLALGLRPGLLAGPGSRRADRGGRDPRRACTGAPAAPSHLRPARRPSRSRWRPRQVVVNHLAVRQPYLLLPNREPRRALQHRPAGQNLP